MYFPSQEKAEEKYGAVTFKVFFDFNNQKLQVEGRFICTTPDIKHFFFYKLLEAESLFYTRSQSASGVSIIFYTVNSFSCILRFS